MLAIDQMDPTTQGIFFLVALVVFAIAAVVSLLERAQPTWAVPAGLALFSVPFAWNAFAAG